MPDEHKDKLMWQSYFFIFRRLKNNVTCFSINNTFISNTWLKFNPKYLISSIKRCQNKNNILNERHAEYCYKIHTSLMKSSAYSPPFYRQTPYMDHTLFYKKTLTLLPNMIFQKAQPPISKGACSHYDL